MIVIRLSRCGRKKKPFYRIVVADNRCPRDGRHIMCIGTFDPILDAADDKKFILNIMKMKEWVFNGAKISNRLIGLLSVYNIKI